MRRIWALPILVVLVAHSARAGNPDVPLAAGETSRVAPAAERKIESSAPAKVETFKSNSRGGAGRPTIRGTQMSEEMRARMKSTDGSMMRKHNRMVSTSVITHWSRITISWSSSLSQDPRRARGLIA